MFFEEPTVKCRQAGISVGNHGNVKVKSLSVPVMTPSPLLLFFYYYFDLRHYCCCEGFFFFFCYLLTKKTDRWSLVLLFGCSLLLLWDFFLLFACKQITDRWSLVLLLLLKSVKMIELRSGTNCNETAKQYC